MANFTVSPNMGLVVPTPGEDPGPDYATNNSNSLNIIDGHTHSNGSGVQITPSGININADLPINSNNLTLINTTRYNNLSASLAGTSPNIACTYFAANDFFVNDGAGNVVQITMSGAVNATSSGISSGTASAAFSGSVLVVNSNTNTPANIQCGSVLIGNNVVSSKFATLQCPSALGADYSLTLPPTNTSGGTAFLTYDTSNNMATGVAVTGGIDTANIANGAITTAKIAAGAVTASKITANYALSSSSASFSTSSVSAVQITALNVSLTTSGGPVWINFLNDGSGTSYIGAALGNNGFYGIHRNGTPIASLQTSYITSPGALNFIDYGAPAGSNAYTFFCSVAGGDTLYMNATLVSLREM